MDKNVVIVGDCLEELKKLPDNSVDSVVTDPPYGLSKEPDIVEVLTKWINNEPYDHKHKGFMGKDWDSFVPHPNIWKEVYRVLKPGGHVLCFAGTRTQDLMTISLRLAGFEIRDVIEFLYASGFPKSMDVGKQFDKKKDDYPKVREVVMFLRDALEKSNKTKKDLENLIGSKAAVAHYLAPSKSNAICPTWERWILMKEFLGFGSEMDQLVWELNGRKGKPGDTFYQREKIGERPNRQKPQYDMANGVANFCGGSAKNEVEIITAPATDLAKKYDGFGTALKPAHEPIIMARKPLEKNVCYNIEKWGTGGLNINGCRIGDFINDKPSGIHRGKIADFSPKNPDDYKPPIKEAKGRFPANCITLEDDQFYSKYFNITPAELSKKASKKDRNSNWKGEQIDIKNIHPTVKSVLLCEWLIKLITPPGGTVLDPFAGSGSTLVAAKKNGFDYIGIEINEEYAEIAEERLKDDKIDVPVVRYTGQQMEDQQAN